MRENRLSLRQGLAHKLIAMDVDMSGAGSLLRAGPDNILFMLGVHIKICIDSCRRCDFHCDLVTNPNKHPDLLCNLESETAKPLGCSAGFLKNKFFSIAHFSMGLFQGSDVQAETNQEWLNASL
jgi:hypothetical protein